MNVEIFDLGGSPSNKYIVGHGYYVILIGPNYPIGVAPQSLEFTLIEFDGKIYNQVTKIGYHT